MIYGQVTIKGTFFNSLVLVNVHTQMFTVAIFSPSLKGGNLV